MRYFLRFILTVLSIYILIELKYLNGVTPLDGVQSLFVFTLMLGLVNLIIGGVLRLITLPIRFLTLGIIGFVISIVVVKITDELVPGVTLEGWTPAIIIALVMGVISSILS